MAEFLTNEEIKEAIALLKNNKIIILPTDTIYGISAICNEENVKRINDLKGSVEDKPLVILVSSLKQAKQFVEVTKTFKEYLFFEMPTTVIYKKRKSNETNAIRMNRRPDLKKIIDAVGPIFSTSVNKTGQDYLQNSKDLIEFSPLIDRVFFTEPLNNKPSNIFNLIDLSKKRWWI